MARGRVIFRSRAAATLRFGPSSLTLIFPFLLAISDLPRQNEDPDAGGLARVHEYSGRHDRDPDFSRRSFAGIEVFFPLRRGETLSQVLSKAGLEGRRISQISAAIQPNISARALRAGMPLGLRRAANGELEQLRLILGEAGSVVVDLGEQPVAARVPLRIDIEERAITGDITSSLVEAVARSGGDEELAFGLAEVFRWDVNFFKDLRPGDSFRVLYEARSADNRQLASGAILAAELTVGGRTLGAYRFQTSGQTAYFGSEGKPLRRTFLKSPLRFARVSSHFSRHRFHPILKAYRPHLGVDFAAPKGTPVMATADGRLRSARYQGGGGNTVRLCHTGGVETVYMHLSGFARGMRPGMPVAQGQVIGYVGMTGLATAPHLDYRIEVRGAFRDPMRLKELAADPLSAAERVRFAAERRRLASTLDELSGGGSRDLLLARRFDDAGGQRVQ